MNDNSLAKLLAVLEPKIQNITENRVEKASLFDVSDTLNTLVELGRNSYKDILNYYDQEFIYRAIKIGKFEMDPDIIIEKYNTSRYLLNINDSNLKDLPQFKDSVDFMNGLYKYLYGLNDKIKYEYECFSEMLDMKELYNKYYILLKKDNIFIKDIDEFLTFLDLMKLDIEDRLNILILVNKSNIKNYITVNDVSINEDLNLSEVSDFINENSNMIGLYYDKVDNIEEYLNKNIESIGESILNVKIYLINLINELYVKKDYKSINKYFKDYKYVVGLEEELIRQKESTEELLFLFKNDKSLVRDYLEKTSSKYKSCVLKNLLDLEKNKSLRLPKMCYNNKYIYLMDNFIVKTVYMYLDNCILVLGVLDKNEKLKDFLHKNDYLINDCLNKKKEDFDLLERDKILKDIKQEDLVLSIDLDTLDVKMEEENGR